MFLIKKFVLNLKIPPATQSEKKSTVTMYSSVRHQGVTYSVGDCCYVDPEAYDFTIKHPKSLSKTQISKDKNVDEDIYPEAYRFVS